MKKEIEIVRFQLLVQAIIKFADDKEPNIRRGALDLLEKIYKNLKKGNNYASQTRRS